DAMVQSASKRGLPRRRLAEPCANHIAHEALVDERGIDARTSYRLPDDERAKFRGGEVLQRAEEFSGGRAHRADDDRIAHDVEVLVELESSDDAGAEQRREPLDDDGPRVPHLTQPCRIPRV